jgi:membrane protease YdiL (CAAX protease family)
MMEQNPYMQYDPNFYLPPEQNPYYKKQQRKNLSRIGFALLIYLTFSNVVELAMHYLCSAFFPQFIEHSAFTMLQQILPSYILGLPLVAGLLLGMPKKRPERKPLKAEGWIIFLAISFFLMMAGSYIANGLMTVLEMVRGEEISNAIDQQITQSSPLVNLILIVICAPIAEELICRKLIIDRLLPYSETLAVVMRGLFFGLLHGNFYQFFYATFLGILFGYVYVKTGNILHTILMHMIINFTGSIIADYIGKMTSDLVSAPTSINPWEIVSVLYSFAMMALAVCGAFLLIRKLKKPDLKHTGECYLTLSTQFKLAWGNPGTIIFCAACGTLFLFSLFI